jgi:hypothetical protein
MAYGAWDIEELLEKWQKHVKKEEKWQAFRHAGYTIKSVDLSAYWRPKHQKVNSKHYDTQAGKALKAVVFGLIGQVGKVGEQRIALLTDLLRGDLATSSEAALEKKLLARVAQTMKDDEITVFDAGFKPQALRKAGVPRFVVRAARNATFRRNELPEYKGGRPPEYGELVRPLKRTFNSKILEATPPDCTTTWDDDGIEMRAECWNGVVLPDQKVSDENQFFWVVAVYDPRYAEPLLLTFSLKLEAKDAAHIYRNRWPIEQPPLASKQMIGAHRQFVSSEESTYRLPELTLLAGSVLTYLAAAFPPIPTGFWDRKPKRTPGRLRRSLDNATFSNLPKPKSGRIRKKASVTAHLPKGILGHRRSKPPVPA